MNKFYNQSLTIAGILIMLTSCTSTQKQDLHVSKLADASQDYTQNQSAQTISKIDNNMPKKPEIKTQATSIVISARAKHPQNKEKPAKIESKVAEKPNKTVPTKTKVVENKDEALATATKVVEDKNKVEQMEIEQAKPAVEAPTIKKEIANDKNETPQTKKNAQTKANSTKKITSENKAVADEKQIAAESNETVKIAKKKKLAAAVLPLKSTTAKVKTPATTQLEKTVHQRLQQEFAAMKGIYEYDILINGELAGKQTIKIDTPNEQTVIMSTEIEMKIDYLLFFTYVHKHQTREVWKNGKLYNLYGYTDDNGKIFRLNLQADGEQMRGTGKDGKMRTVIPNATNNAWNLGPMLKHFAPIAIMNPETGVVRTLQIEERPDQFITVAGKKIDCTHVRFQNQDWKFWFAPSGMLIKQEDVLLGYTVEIVMRKHLLEQ